MNTPALRHTRSLALILGLTCIRLAAAAPAWDTYSDTWVATDGLGRSLPTAAETGAPRPDKFVGMFYFLWLGQHGEAGPFDISKILAANPGAITNKNDPAWGPMYVPHHWGESVFGYYVSEDEAVLAKHAQMLGDAGVDVVIFDVTNQLTYPRSWKALVRAFGRMRELGNRVPQIAFLCPFWDPAKVARELYRDLYGPGISPELWFRWEGRPLILADPERLGTTWGNDRHDHPARLDPGHTLAQQFTAPEAFESVALSCPTWTSRDAAATLVLRGKEPGSAPVAQQRFMNIQDNAWLTMRIDPPAPAGSYVLEMSEPQGAVGWWSHHADRLTNGCARLDGQDQPGDRTLRVSKVDPEAAAMRQLFTFRKPQPDYFTGPRGLGEWGWLEVHPQHGFAKETGKVEQVAVGVAQNAVAGKLGVLSNPQSHGRSFHGGREPGPEGQDFTGRNFDEQWRRAMQLDPAFVFVTGWNEWIAGRFDETASFHGVGPVSFVDEFNPEFSRDIEPMVGGHTDAYYYQFIAWARRFKGARGLPAVEPGRIRIDGRFDDWRAVGPEFRDTAGDPVQRDEWSWDRKARYVNRSGRRDLLEARVSWNRSQLQFYLRCAAPLDITPTSPGPHLLLDLDRNATNGWLGFDARVSISSSSAGLVERHQGQGYGWIGATPVKVAARGCELELSIPLKSLGVRGIPDSIDFKWEDHCIEKGDPQEFTINGDAAPNDRYCYRAILKRK